MVLDLGALRAGGARAGQDRRHLRHQGCGVDEFQAGEARGTLSGDVRSVANVRDPSDATPSRGARVDHETCVWRRADVYTHARPLAVADALWATICQKWVASVTSAAGVSVTAPSPPDACDIGVVRATIASAELQSSAAVVPAVAGPSTGFGADRAAAGGGASVVNDQIAPAVDPFALFATICQKYVVAAVVVGVNDVAVTPVATSGGGFVVPNRMSYDVVF